MRSNSYIPRFFTLIACLLITSYVAWSEGLYDYPPDVIVDGISYHLSCGRATVVHDSLYSGSIIIPPKITVNDNKFEVKAIESCAFVDCKGVAEIQIPDGLEYIGGYAFWNCTGLTKVVIPKSVRYVGSLAFVGCTGLKELDTYLLMDNVTMPFQSKFKYTLRGSHEEIPSGLFVNSTIQELEIVDDVVSIGASAFSGCSALTRVKLSDKVKYIREYAFANTGIYEINLPDSLKIVEQAAFNGCRNLSFIRAGKDCRPEKIHYSAFPVLPQNSLENDDIIYVGKMAYRYIGSGTSPVILFEDCISVADKCFYDCGAPEIHVPKNVKHIGEMAFHGFKNAIKIDSYLESIGDMAFQWCDGLYDIPNFNDNVSIGYKAFDGCPCLPDDKMIYLGNKAVEWHYYGNDITHVDIRDGTEEILSNCFVNTNIKSVNLPLSLKEIGDGAFASTQIQSIIIPDSVTYIGKDAFRSCKDLKSIHLPHKLCAINDASFLDCIEIEQLYIPEHCVSIGSNAFSGCTKLQTISGASNLHTIKRNAFYGCSSLANFPFITSKISVVERQAFDGCRFSELSFPETLKCLEYGAFRNNRFLNKLALSSGTTSINSNAFGNSPFTKMEWEFANCDPYGDETATIQDQYIDVKANELSFSSEVIKMAAIGFMNKTVETAILSSAVKFLDINSLYSPGIKNIVCYSMIPPLTSANLLGFWEILQQGTLYIPREAFYNYASSAIWKNFGRILDLEGNEIVPENGSMFIEPNEIELKVGDAIQLYVVSDKFEIDSKNLNWLSLNEDVCIVDSFGCVRSLQPGEAVITATMNVEPKISATCVIKVTESSGLNSISADEKKFVKIYNMSGLKIYEGPRFQCNLPPGIFIVISQGYSEIIFNK